MISYKNKTVQMSVSKIYVKKKDITNHILQYKDNIYRSIFLSLCFKLRKITIY